MELKNTPKRKGTLLAIVLLGTLATVLALIAVDTLAIGSMGLRQPRPVMEVVKLAGDKTVAPVVYLSVTPGIKPGPDGQLHDAFSVTNFVVHPNQPVKLVINNTDTVPHSITSPMAGVSIVVRPGTHTYTLLVRKTGSFMWMCAYPCDPYSMSTVGYMRGHITSV